MRVELVVSFILALASASSAAAVGRIVGGQETSISQYPFMAIILQSHDSSFFMPACAGAILNANNVVTLASCWTGFTSVKLRVAVGSSSSISGGTVMTVNRFRVPVLFNPVTLEHNIGILGTTDAIIFVPNTVMPGQFASANTVVPDNSIVTIAGWGRTEVSHFSEQLRHVQVQTISNSDCAVQSSPDLFVPNTMICTTGSGSFPAADVCVGDNGSPVILNNIVVGLVNHPRCGYGRPSVHTRVSSFAWFIERAS